MSDLARQDMLLIMMRMMLESKQPADDLLAPQRSLSEAADKEFCLSPAQLRAILGKKCLTKATYNEFGFLLSRVGRPGHYWWKVARI
jgi:hypothetical protein